MAEDFDKLTKELVEKALLCTSLVAGFRLMALIRSGGPSGNN